MNECPSCKWSYPVNILFNITGTIKSELVCGICALDIVNKAHSVKRKRFDGEQAENYRRQAIQWRKNHPEKAPKK